MKRYLPRILLRVWYRLTGNCVSYRPDERGICKVCRWERPT